MAVTILKGVREKLAQLIAPHHTPAPPPPPSAPEPWPFPTSSRHDPDPSPGPLTEAEQAAYKQEEIEDKQMAAAMPLPWEDDLKDSPVQQVQNVMEALREVGTRKGTLYLVHRKSGDEYKVVSWDGERAKLIGPMSMVLYPKITDRENDKYEAVWR
jgi:hypothetical protein